MRITQQQLGGIRWIVADGDGEEVFAQLGALMRETIQEIAGDAEAHRLRQLAGTREGQLDAVMDASAAAYPRAWAELTALADGAGLPVEALALLNCRGDLAGAISGGAGEDAESCSDLAWSGGRSFIAHNEDEPVSYQGLCALLTLHLDGQQPVTAYWVPGFLPANAFSVTGPGVVISVDHVPALAPAKAPGRAFVARELQRAATSAAEAVEFLGANPSAGGFSYTIGDPAGHVVIVEAAAGECGWREVSDLAWHTNHGRYIKAAGTRSRGTSVRRGEILDALDGPADAEPDHDWFLAALDTVRADPTSGKVATTLCTFVAELSTGQILVRDRDASPVTLRIVDFLAGRPLV